MADNEQSIDYLKLIPIVISIFALGVSFLSWRESHRNTTLNEAINRPQLNVTQLSARIDAKQKDFTDIEILIRVKNIGKVSAKVERSTIEVNLYQSPCELIKSEKLDTVDSGWNVSFTLDAGAEQELGRHIRIPTKCAEESLRSKLFLFIVYNDEVTNAQYSQYISPSFNLPLGELRRKPAETVGITF